MSIVLLCIQVLQVGVDIDISHMLVTCLKMKHACQTIFPLGHMPFKDICYSLLQNKSGDQFSCDVFSAHLKQVIYSLTDEPAGVQVLRSVFLMQCDHKLRNLSSLYGGILHV